MRPIKFWLLISAILFVSIGSLIIFLGLQQPRSTGKRFTSFSIESGQSFKSVSERLKNENLIRSQSLFYYLGRLTAKSGDLKAGEYEINAEMSAWEVLKVITGSHVKLYKLTLPEGVNMFQIAQLLDSMGLVDEMQFLESCWDPVLLAELHIPSLTAEGYLFPETYHIPRGSSPRAILRMFVDMFWTKMPENFLSLAKNNPLSFHEAVIMASVIEKETGLVGEMGLISSVFYNRLKSRMRLQSDPTAVYDIMPYGGRVTRGHLQRKSPFNTYQIDGLPLTPIGNPGLLSIQAALLPQSSDYLYFVSRRDGSHHFSSTYDEHRGAIEKFLQ
ncbi:MAG: endolytic transglycosylase MltG [Deltaproteobacteria bacterium]|nr:endolytic transglycosylase MltG [Deltaproteobacteria bacterium]